MAKYRMVKFLNPDKAVLEKNGKWFVASFADIPYSGPEVLVFPSTEDGRIEDWSEVDGRRGLNNLAEFLCEACLVDRS